MELLLGRQWLDVLISVCGLKKASTSNVSPLWMCKFVYESYSITYI